MLYNNDSTNKWYVLKIMAGNEKKICINLQLTKDQVLPTLFEEFYVPEEHITDWKNGKLVTKKQKLFPGYIFIKMYYNINNWRLIKQIPKIIGIIGDNNPSFISHEEIELMKHHKYLKNNIPNVTSKFNFFAPNIFQLGESLKINNGPFTNFNGVIKHIDYAKNKLILDISIFGRPTPIELGFNQVSKY